MTDARVRTDVVVVGAGLSGLTAARRLAQRGIDVAVVEAKERVGGRVATKELVAGKTIELGARFTGPGQDDVQGLASEVGVDTFDVYMKGKAIWCYNGQSTTFEYQDGIPLSAIGQREYQDALEELDRLAATVDPDAPWETPRARQLDLMSFQAWLDTNFSDDAARHALALDLVVFFSNPASRTSMLQVVSFISSMPDRTQGLANSEFFRFVGGPYEIARRVAEELGERVHLGCPVRWIEWGEADGVTVHADGLVIGARRAIVAMSPTDARAIEFRPMLPPYRDMLHRLGQSGGGLANMLVYDEPFWREDGLSGIFLSNNPAATWARDCSPEDGSPGVLVTFMIRECPPGTPWGVPREVIASEKTRREGMIEALAQGFGLKIREPRDYIEQDWHEVPFTSGCQLNMPPGLYTQVEAAYRDPVGPLHWSSTEHGARYQLMMNGAVQSGERAAAEVIERLDPVTAT
jgi:monoamine oxidase